MYFLWQVNSTNTVKHNAVILSLSLRMFNHYVHATFTYIYMASVSNQWKRGRSIKLNMTATPRIYQRQNRLVGIENYKTFDIFIPAEKSSIVKIFKVAFYRVGAIGSGILHFTPGGIITRSASRLFGVNPFRLSSETMWRIIHDWHTIVKNVQLMIQWLPHTKSIKNYHQSIFQPNIWTQCSACAFERLKSGPFDVD